MEKSREDLVVDHFNCYNMNKNDQKVENNKQNTSFDKKDNQEQQTRTLLQEQKTNTIPENKVLNKNGSKQKKIRLITEGDSSSDLEDEDKVNFLIKTNRELKL